MQGWFLRFTLRFSCVSIFLCATALYGQINYDSARLERQLKPFRTAETITLDGRLDEPAWSQAPVATEFIQNEPQVDNPASEETEVRVLYDSENLYFGVYAYDAEPSRIIISDLRKDFSRNNGDSFEVVLDTFQDGRNGYQFAINPAGAKWDAQMTNEGRETNDNWDGVWSVKTRIVEDGWIAEIAIPFRTLKFRKEELQNWGINFQRKIRRRNEDSFWSPLPRIYSLNRVSLAGTLDDIEGVKPGANLRVKPYFATSFSQPNGGTSLVPGEKESTPFCRWARGGGCYDADFGVDVKYALTPGLTWDFTYNTDFSQVEADEQQVNLTRFSLFFPEKREFFLENSGIFQFGANPDRGGGGGFAGAGGRQNALRNDFVFFFSRRIGLSDEGSALPILGGTRLTGRLGSSYEVGFLNIQQEEFGSNQATNFTVARLRRNILANSDIGVILVNKSVMDSTHFNRVLGTDANFRIGQSLNLNAYLAKSFVEGGGDENVAGRFNTFYKTNRVDLRTSYATIQEDFVNEMGFVPRVGNHKIAGRYGWTFRPERLRGLIRNSEPHFQFEYLMDKHGNLTVRHMDYHLPFRFQNGSFVEIGANPTLERFDEEFVINRNKDIAIPPGVYSFYDYFITSRSDRSRAISGGLSYSTGDFYTGYKHSYGVRGTFRFGYKLETSFGYTHHNINLPEGHFKTNLLTTRFNYSFSTAMFLNALVQYNSDTQQVSSNVRFNLIHRPLSDIFVVYNERRDSVGGDLTNRALILKVTYMVAR